MATKKTKAKKAKKPSPRTAASKRPTKSKKGAPTKAAAKKTPAPRKKPEKPARKRAAPTSTKAAKTQAAVPHPKTFAAKVRDCDAGTGVWFITAGSVEHAAIQKRGSDGAVVIVTDAGVPEVVPVSNLFETADEARAAR
jgi:hypothetical protein